MSDELYDALRHVADLAADEYDLDETTAEGLFDTLIREVEIYQ